MGRADLAGAAVKEIITNFPEAAAVPAHYLRGYIFIDDLVDEMIEGLEKAGLPVTGVETL